jgi:outer membrane protein
VFVVRPLYGLLVLALLATTAHAQAAPKAAKRATTAQSERVAPETLMGALAKAYRNNPELNAARAQLRAIDETVNQANAGWRPRLTATGDIGVQDQATRIVTTRSSDTSNPRGYGVSVEQNIFNGFKTENGIDAAKSQVRAGRESLRNTEQNIFMETVEAYMNVLRDTAILNLRSNNIEVLEEQQSQTVARFEVGEVTKTDVAQGEARLARARSERAVALAVLKSSLAQYRRVIGADPKTLTPAKGEFKQHPASLEQALKEGDQRHPAIAAANFGADAAALQIRIAQGDLLPTVGVQAGWAKRWEPTSALDESSSASIVGRISVPLYDGGVAYSRSRQAKETAAQQELMVEATRDKVRAAVIAAWSNVDAAKVQLEAAQAQVKAAESALMGVREEAKVGQRTTLDVLNAQQELLDARSALVTAQRNRVVTSYALLSATGRMDAIALGLPVRGYDPTKHYDAVKNKWIGFSAPSGAQD